MGFVTPRQLFSARAPFPAQFSERHILHIAPLGTLEEDAINCNQRWRESVRDHGGDARGSFELLCIAAESIVGWSPFRRRPRPALHRQGPRRILARPRVPQRYQLLLPTLTVRTRASILWGFASRVARTLVRTSSSGGAGKRANTWRRWFGTRHGSSTAALPSNVKRNHWWKSVGVDLRIQCRQPEQMVLGTTLDVAPSLLRCAFWHPNTIPAGCG